MEVEEYPVVRFDPDAFEVDENGKVVLSPGANFLRFTETEVKFVPHLCTCEEITESEVE
jgi:hypothetical protein